jgi:drug/metabolite transporter (DMT)-like permease
MASAPSHFLPPVAGLIVGAIAWGLIWYPYRLLDTAGIGGTLATCITYSIALAFAALMFPKAWKQWARAPAGLAAIALFAGCTNLAYVLGVLEGEVMRVLLLFYLAPLWTVPLAALILHERPSAVGYFIIALALAGAVVMLWNPARGWPLPHDRAEWFGVASGFAFALSNVFTRKLAQIDIPAKSLAVFSGVVVLTLALLPFEGNAASSQSATAAASWPLLLAIGAALFIMSLAVQYGLTHTPANRAIVILLFELIVAAASAYWLAGEIMKLQEWIGGAMIIAASLFSGRIASRPPDRKGV